MAAAWAGRPAWVLTTVSATDNPTALAECDVAIIIVTYKSARLTIAALQSVADETPTAGVRLRAVVVDNASGDAPQVIDAVRANAWNDWVEVVVAPKNGGFAYGNNLGLETAYLLGSPDYVYLMNPDAQLRQGAIGSLVRFMQAHPDVGITGSSIEDPDGTLWPIAFRFPGMLSELDGGLQFGLLSRLLGPWQTVRVMTQVCQPTDWVSGASMMIRAAVFEAIGGFDENYFLYFEETDFCYRARRAGYLTWYVPESRVMHIRGASTKIGDATATPRRLPAYWFASRRRYFYVTQGLARAMAIDAVALIAYSLGWMKLHLQRRRAALAPRFVLDLFEQSILWRRNRTIPPLLCSANIGPWKRR